MKCHKVLLAWASSLLSALPAGAVTAVLLPNPQVPGFRFPESEATIVNWVYEMGNGPPADAATAFENMNRSEEHTSELQSLRHLVCRLLLEKKKNKHKISAHWKVRLKLAVCDLGPELA